MNGMYNRSIEKAFGRRALMRMGAGLLVGGWSGRRGLGQEGAVEHPAGQPRLKVTRVTTYLLRHRLQHAFGASVSVPLPTTRKALLVKIETDAGLVGWGETAPISGARGTIDEQIAPLLIGQNPLDYRRLWRLMWGANFGNGLAVGAVDTALNDIRGKAMNMPITQLFGGPVRRRVPTYASAMDYTDGRAMEEHYPKAARDALQRGFKAMKMRVGRYSVARESKVAAEVRDLVGPNVQLMADGNGAYTAGNAIRMAHALNELDFEFLEEPLPQVAPRYTGYADLRGKMPLPLAGGEAVDSRGSALQLIDRRAFDIIQPDISLCGGLGEALFIAELAQLAGIRCIPHCWGGDILIAATVQLLALLYDPHWGLPTDTPMLELDQSENPWRDGLAVEPLRMQDGFMEVPTKPGLGIEVDEEVVKQYAV